MDEAVGETLEQQAAGEKRERSSIEFPYMGLDEALEVARAVHQTTGSEVCQADQLAAALGLSMSSSGFRVRLATSKMFGVIDSERGSGAVRLTDLGHRIIDPSQEARAKVEAFLSVPLYSKLVETHRGKTLPPPAALERVMGGMGVAKKQTDRARQTFERSAQSAGFFKFGRDKLVMPTVTATATGEAHGGSAVEGRFDSGSFRPAAPEPAKAFYGGGGPAPGITGDPLIDALVLKLPPKGGEWPRAERDTWLKMIEMAFDLAYGVSPKTAGPTAS